VAQLALAHTYGNGLEQSSRNLVSTVSDLMYGVHIDHYVTLNMDAIAILNDAVGGVTVEVTEDFSDVDPTIPMGKVRLTGKQAVSYIRIRRDVDDQLNLSRMERHEKYMDAFFKQLKEKLGEDSSFAVSLFQDLGDHMVTDCDVTTLSNLVKKYGDGELGQILSIKGENVLGEKYYEYYLDEDDLDRVIVDHLYEPKK
jgi:LCP family protein required for cell wall assembly